MHIDYDFNNKSFPASYSGVVSLVVYPPSSSIYRPSVHISLGAGNWDSIENEAHFIQIMQAFGQSFMQPDITIFKHNLEALESLNSKYKLYHKVWYPPFYFFIFIA